eukprot:1155641-Pelagomonas_calceolata.AAC.1
MTESGAPWKLRLQETKTGSRFLKPATLRQGVALPIGWCPLLAPLQEHPQQGENGKHKAIRATYVERVAVGKA